LYFMKEKYLELIFCLFIILVYYFYVPNIYINKK